jgi:hypothetical protein
MALTSGTIIEVEFGGNDTNGGGFDVSQTSTPDLSATAGNAASPVVTSSSYNFQASDVGAWVYIQAGTNWTKGWYKIASVASNAATLNAAIGSAVLANSIAQPTAMSTVAGCATVASPTAGRWSIDYSQQTTAISLTTPTTSAANAIILTASATKAMIGNLLRIAAGTNFIVGTYVVTTAVAGTSLTVDRACTVAAGSAATVNLGGALASLGMAGSIVVAQNFVFQQYNASAYLITSSTANIAGGIYGGAAGRVVLTGYNTNRILGNTDLLKPTNQASGISNTSIFGTTTSGPAVTRNIILDGQNLTGIQGFNNAGGVMAWCTAKNCQARGINAGYSNPTELFYCLTINCNGSSATMTGSTASYCASVNANGSNGISVQITNNCLAINGTGSGFTAAASTYHTNDTSYGNAGDGFLMGGTDTCANLNCLSYGNGGLGFNANSKLETSLINCASGGNTGANFDPVFLCQSNNITLGGGNPFANSSATINTILDVFAAFQLGVGGAAARAASYTPYTDIGAAQHKDSGGIYSANLQGGFQS